MSQQMHERAMATLTARRGVAHFYVQFDDVIRQTALLSDFTTLQITGRSYDFWNLRFAMRHLVPAPTADILPLSSIS